MGLTEMIRGINNKVMHVQYTELIKETALCINAACPCSQKCNIERNEKRKQVERKKRRLKKRASEIK